MEGEIWKVVEGKFNALSKERPVRQEKATGYHYGEKTYEVLAAKKEVRNIACNLTWTDPAENTCLQSDISLATVERLALDKREQRRWLDPLPRRLVRLGKNEGGQHAKLLLRSSKKA